MIPLNRICSCGRPWVHCVACGSGSFYNLHRDSVSETQKTTGKPVNETGLTVRIYKCMRCGEIFSDADKACTAPSQSQKRAVRSALKHIESQIAEENSSPTAETMELPDGWSRNAEGKIESPVSLEDIIRKEPSK